MLASISHSHRIVAALAGAIVFPTSMVAAAVPVEAPAAQGAVAEKPTPPTGGAQQRDPQFPSESCLADTLCELKDKVRWRQAAWTPDFCRKLARGVLTSSSRHGVAPALLLAVMMNESDLNENAVHITLKDGEIYAKDSGLMGIRCVLDKQGRCTNNKVKGLTWKQVMEPLTNIDLGARELAHWRHNGIMRTTVRVREGGQVITKEKVVPCQHKTHAYWAHYNHGPRYIDSGRPRHYPHRIAVLYHALAKAMGLDTPELESMARITINDPGKRVRTADRPVEPRYRKLCDQIRGAASVCSNVATLTN